ncbi:MAG: hypothetical protein EBY80_14775 [Actinobacteria bacterium]|nr:hypothetical protein [Actinomycetota bacterium]NDA79474.1 hypothetical protein [Actinomycetota bacterium]
MVDRYYSFEIQTIQIELGEYIFCKFQTKLCVFSALLHHSDKFEQSHLYDTIYLQTASIYDIEVPLNRIYDLLDGKSLLDNLVFFFRLLERWS